MVAHPKGAGSRVGEGPGDGRDRAGQGDPLLESVRGWTLSSVVAVVVATGAGPTLPNGLPNCVTQTNAAVAKKFRAFAART